MVAPGRSRGPIRCVVIHWRFTSQEGARDSPGHGRVPGGRRSREDDQRRADRAGPGASREWLVVTSWMRPEWPGPVTAVVTARNEKRIRLHEGTQGPRSGPNIAREKIWRGGPIRNAVSRSGGPGVEEGRGAWRSARPAGSSERSLSTKLSGPGRREHLESKENAPRRPVSAAVRGSATVRGWPRRAPRPQRW